MPQFVGGTIERVVKTRGQDESWTYNIYVVGLAMEDVNGYEGALKARGWKAQSMQMGDKAGMLNAQKGTMAMHFAYGLEEQGGTLAVYNRP